MTQALKWGESHLSELVHSNPMQETLWLAREVMGREDPYLIPNLSETEWKKFQAIILKRKEGMPLAYLTKNIEFMGLDFELNENVLIPRPETEILGSLASKLCEGIENPTVLDIGTGSGALAITLAHRCKHASICATDICRNALNVAKKNATLHNVGDRIEFIETYLYDGISLPFNIIISNPPYIKSADIDFLQREIQNEPRIALDGGEDGLRLLNPIIDGSTNLLRIPGYLLLEIGEELAGDVVRRMEKNRFVNCEVIQDLNGKDRVVKGEWHG